jgi:hypothetical protein
MRQTSTPVNQLNEKRLPCVTKNVAQPKYSEGRVCFCVSLSFCVQRVMNVAAVGTFRRHWHQLQARDFRRELLDMLQE